MSSQPNSEPSKVVITNTPHGVSIKIMDSNPATRYLPVETQKGDAVTTHGGGTVIIKKVK
jgi:hypothetical protein